LTFQFWFLFPFLGLLQIKMLWTLMYKSMYKQVFPFLWGKWYNWIIW
jgi:hypothetical protein